MVKYKAVEAGSVDELNIEVNILISDGWLPLGGAAVSLSESDEYQYFVATQAMTKTEEE